MAEDEKGNIPGMELKKGQLLRGVEKREKKLGGNPVRMYAYKTNAKLSYILF